MYELQKSLDSMRAQKDTLYFPAAKEPTFVKAIFTRKNRPPGFVRFAPIPYYLHLSYYYENTFKFEFSNIWNMEILFFETL